MFSDGYNEFSLEEWLRKNEEDDNLDDFDYWEDTGDEYVDTGDTDIEIP